MKTNKKNELFLNTLHFKANRSYEPKRKLDSFNKVRGLSTLCKSTTDTKEQAALSGLENGTSNSIFTTTIGGLLATKEVSLTGNNPVEIKGTTKQSPISTSVSSDNYSSNIVNIFGKMANKVINLIKNSSQTIVSQSELINNQTLTINYKINAYKQGDEVEPVVTTTEKFVEELRYSMVNTDEKVKIDVIPSIHTPDSPNDFANQNQLTISSQLSNNFVVNTEANLGSTSSSAATLLINDQLKTEISQVFLAFVWKITSMYFALVPASTGLSINSEKKKKVEVPIELVLLDSTSLSINKDISRYRGDRVGTSYTIFVETGLEELYAAIVHLTQLKKLPLVLEFIGFPNCKLYPEIFNFDGINTLQQVRVVTSDTVLFKAYYDNFEWSDYNNFEKFNLLFEKYWTLVPHRNSTHHADTFIMFMLLNYNLQKGTNFSNEFKVCCPQQQYPAYIGLFRIFQPQTKGSLLPGSTFSDFLAPQLFAFFKIKAMVLCAFDNLSKHDITTDLIQSDTNDTANKQFEHNKNSLFSSLASETKFMHGAGGSKFNYALYLFFPSMIKNLLDFVYKGNFLNLIDDNLIKTSGINTIIGFAGMQNTTHNVYPSLFDGLEVSVEKDKFSSVKGKDVNIDVLINTILVPGVALNQPQLNITYNDRQTLVKSEGDSYMVTTQLYRGLLVDNFGNTKLKIKLTSAENTIYSDVQSGGLNKLTSNAVNAKPKDPVQSTKIVTSKKSGNIQQISTLFDSWAYLLRTGVMTGEIFDMVKQVDEVNLSLGFPIKQFVFGKGQDKSLFCNVTYIQQNEDLFELVRTLFNNMNCKFSFVPISESVIQSEGEDTDDADAGDFEGTSENQSNFNSNNELRRSFEKRGIFNEGNTNKLTEGIKNDLKIDNVCNKNVGKHVKLAYVDMVMYQDPKSGKRLKFAYDTTEGNCVTDTLRLVYNKQRKHLFGKPGFKTFDQVWDEYKDKKLKVKDIVGFCKIHKLDVCFINISKKNEMYDVFFSTSNKRPQHFILTDQLSEHVCLLKPCFKWFILKYLCKQWSNKLKRKFGSKRVSYIHEDEVKYRKEDYRSLMNAIQKSLEKPSDFEKQFKFDQPLLILFERVAGTNFYFDIKIRVNEEVIIYEDYHKDADIFDQYLN